MEVTTFDATDRLSALLDEVTRGNEVTITRRGLPIAKLVPIGAGFDREAARRAAEELRRASKRATLGGLRIRDLVDEGRS